MTGWLRAMCVAGMGVAGVAGACPTEEVDRLQGALSAAPLSSETPDGPDAQGAAPERRCGLSQAEVVRAVLSRCRPRPDQSVLLLGAGRCLQQAGFRQEAARSYRQFFDLASADRSVSPDRSRERRDRVRRWLREMGEEAPDTATLILRSNLGGAEVRHLAGEAEAQLPILGEGDTRLLLPPGPRRLSLGLKGFARVEVPVDLVDGAETRTTVDWRDHLQPRYAILRQHWDDFRKSGLTPAGYADRRQRPFGVALSLLVLGAGAAVIGVCAANVNESCDAAWKQGLGYAGGGLLAGAGLVGALSSLLARAEKLPQATLPSTPVPP